MENFCDTLNQCQLHDLGYKGIRFTWCTMQHDEDFVKERLDRALANNEYRDVFPIRLVKILANWSSDHTPMYVQFSGVERRYHHGRRKFHYEEEWSGHECTKAIIHQVWWVKIAGIGVRQKVRRKLEQSKDALLNWAKRNRRLVEELIGEKTCEIEKLQEKEGLLEIDKYNQLQREVNFLIE